MLMRLQRQYRKLDSNVRIALEAIKAGQGASFSEKHSSLAAMVTLSDRFEAKALVSTVRIGEQKLDVLSRQFKEIYLIGQYENKKYPLNPETRAQCKIERYFDIAGADLAKTLGKLKGPALVRILQTPDIDQVLKNIMKSEHRNPLMIELQSPGDDEKFDSLLNSAKENLTDYYFDTDGLRLFCHPF